MTKTKKLLPRSEAYSTQPDAAFANLQPQSNAGARPLSERVMLVRFSIGRWYGTGADNQTLEDLRQRNDAKGEIGTFTKRLMDKRHLSKINRVTNEARQFFKGKTLSYDDGNLRLLAVEHFFEVKKKMSSYERSFSIAVEEFLSTYKQAVDGEKHRLGRLWRESDYPSIDALRERFRFELHFRPMEDADDLRINLPKEELEAIRKEITEAVAKNVEEALGGLIDRLRGMLEDIARRMKTPGERLPTTMIEELRALCRDLPGFNVTNNPALRDAADTLNAQFATLGTNEEIVKDAGKREEAGKAVDKALKALDVLKKGAKNEHRPRKTAPRIGAWRERSSRKRSSNAR
jgi:hypothetical protein